MSYKTAARIRPLNIRSLGQIPQGTMSDISNISQIVSSGIATIINATQQQQQAAPTPTPTTPAPTPVPTDLLAPATSPSPSWMMPVMITGGLVLVGGLAFMVMRKRAVKANRRRRMRRNGRRSRRNSGRRRSRRSTKLSHREAKRLLISRGVPMGRDVHELSTSQLVEVAEVSRRTGYRKSKRASGSTGRMYYQYLSRVRGNRRRSRRSLRRNTKGQHAFLYYRGGRGYYRDANGQIRSMKLKPYEEHKGHGHSFHEYLRSTRAKGPSRKSARFLQMNRLTAKQRARIPLKAFVFPERRSWPIDNARRAYAATQMMRMGRVGSASDFNSIRNVIRSRYPKVWDIYGRNITWDRTKAARMRARRSRASRGRRSTRIAANRRRSRGRRSRGVRANSSASRYLHTFFEEKDLPNVQFEVRSPNGTMNWMDTETVIEAIYQAPPREQAQIADTLRRIDFVNGKVQPFLEHLAKALARDLNNNSKLSVPARASVRSKHLGSARLAWAPQWRFKRGGASGPAHGWVTRNVVLEGSPRARFESWLATQ